MKKKIAVGLSGGVDSSFAAWILKKEGWEVIGITLKFFPQDNRCCDFDSLYQAQRLCQTLDIPHHVLDVGDLFKDKIIHDFIDSYLLGLTPNPCVLCNKFIKFGWLFDKVKSWGIDYLATGHYVDTVCDNDKYFLTKAYDYKKSQEYFLSLIEPGILPNLVFPLADYSKEDVKRIVYENNIFFKERGESQDVCFVTEKPYGNFILNNIDTSDDLSGDICHIDGKILGRHNGFYNYTYGQREGLGIGWHEALYVVGINPKTKVVTVCERDRAFCDSFAVSGLNWFDSIGKYRNIEARLRYNSPLLGCKIDILNSDSIKVKLNKRISGIAPGQICCFYSKNRVIGAGVIEAIKE